ncbi:MAG: hypothetical protein ACE366_25860 [Bradymonadia bacterium]
MSTLFRSLALRIVKAQFGALAVLLIIAWGAALTEGRSLTLSTTLTVVCPLAGLWGLCWAALRWRQDGALTVAGSAGLRPGPLLCVVALMPLPWWSGVAAPRSDLPAPVITTDRLVIPTGDVPLIVTWGPNGATRLDTSAVFSTLPPPKMSDLPAPAASLEASAPFWRWVLPWPWATFALLALWGAPAPLRSLGALIVGALAFGGAHLSLWLLHALG